MFFVGIKVGKVTTWYGSGDKPLCKTGSGDNGSTFSFRVGSVRSGDKAEVSNSGTGSNVVLDFVLPKGEKGEKGDGGASGIGALFEGLSVEIATLQDMLPFQSMQMGKELCVVSNPNVTQVETWGIGNSACYKITYPMPFSKVPVLMVTSSRSTRQLRAFEVVEQTATHFLVASNYWGNDCLVNWVAFEPL